MRPVNLPGRVCRTGRHAAVYVYEPRQTESATLARREKRGHSVLLKWQSVCLVTEVSVEYPHQGGMLGCQALRVPGWESLLQPLAVQQLQ